MMFWLAALALTIGGGALICVGERGRRVFGLAGAVLLSAGVVMLFVGATMTMCR
jgi:hypothetical protein